MIPVLWLRCLRRQLASWIIESYFVYLSLCNLAFFENERLSHQEASWCGKSIKACQKKFNSAKRVVLGAASRMVQCALASSYRGAACVIEILLRFWYVLFLGLHISKRLWQCLSWAEELLICVLILYWISFQTRCCQERKSKSYWSDLTTPFLLPIVIHLSQLTWWASFVKPGFFWSYVAFILKLVIKYSQSYVETLYFLIYSAKNSKYLK